MAILFWTLTSVAVYWLSWIIYAIWLHPCAKYPGPFLTSISRLWYMREALMARVADRQRDLHRKYGPIVRIAPNEVVIADPSALKTIYGFNSGFTKTDFYDVFQAPWARFPELFSAKDEQFHASRRKIVSHIYSMSNVVRSEHSIDLCSRVLLDAMRQMAEKGAPTNIAVWIRWYSFDIIGELFFSRRFGFLEKREDRNGWIHAVDQLDGLMTLLGVAPSYARRFILRLGTCVPSISKAVDALGMFGVAAERCITESQPSAGNNEDMLASIIKIMDQKGSQVDFGPVEVKSEIHTALIAGSDTASTAITAILYYLLKTPEVYQKLRDEIDGATANGQLSSPIPYQEATKLPYLDACCKEGMRLFPSVGLSLPRQVPPGGREISRQFFPAGVRVGLNPNTVHRDKDLFGEDADEFRPQRWLCGEAPNMERHILQFGAGPRTCIGKNIALCQIYKIIPELLRSFDLELVDVGPSQGSTVSSRWLRKISRVSVRVSERTASQGATEM